MGNGPNAVRTELAQASLGTRLRDDPLLRNNAIYLSGTIAVGAVTYAFHFATGRLLGPASYAVVAAMVSAFSLISLPSIVLQTTAARYASLLLARGDVGAIRQFLIKLTGACLLAFLPITVLLVVLTPAVASYLRVVDTRLVYLLVLASVFALLVSITRGAFQGLSRFVVLSMNLLVEMTTRLVVAVALVAGGFGTLGAAIGLAAGTVVSYAQSLFILRRPGQSRSENSPRLAEVGRYTASAIVAAAGITYLLNVDVILSRHFLSGHDSGLYAAGAVLGRIIYFLGITVAAVMFPEVTVRHAQGGNHFVVVDKSLLLLALMSIGFVATCALVPGVVAAPFGGAFTGIQPFLVVFAAAISLFALSILLINYFLSVNSRRFMTPLVGACLLETALIAEFHTGPAQVVAMVLLTMGALMGSLLVLYGLDRLRGRATA